MLNIKLSKVKPIGRNVLLGIITSFTLLISTMFILIVSGYYVFDINQILPPTSWSLLFMLIPGIFEELAFRGVFLPIMLKKYSKTRDVLFNSLLFGAFHFCNLISYALVGLFSQEDDWIYILLHRFFRFYSPKLDKSGDNLCTE